MYSGGVREARTLDLSGLIRREVCWCVRCGLEVPVTRHKLPQQICTRFVSSRGIHRQIYYSRRHQSICATYCRISSDIVVEKKLMTTHLQLLLELNNITFCLISYQNSWNSHAGKIFSKNASKMQDEASLE